MLVVTVGVLVWGQVLPREVALVQIVRDGALTGALTREVDEPEAAARARVLAGLSAEGPRRPNSRW